MRKRISQAWCSLVERLKNFGSRYANWYKPRTHMFIVSGVALVSITTSIATTYFDVKSIPRDGIHRWESLLFVGFLVAYFVIPMAMVIATVVIAVFQRRKFAQLSVLVASYLSIIVIFTGFYLTECYVSDYNDCVVRYSHWKYENGIPKSDRAIAGIEPRFWQLWLDDFQLTAAEEYELRNFNRDKEMGDAIFRVPNSRKSILVACFHFSVQSMTFSGTDKIPKSTRAKLAHSVQLLISIFLVVVLFGILVADWPGRPKQESATSAPGGE